MDDRIAVTQVVKFKPSIGETHALKIDRPPTMNTIFAIDRSWLSEKTNTPCLLWQEELAI